jgi:hypothetical protein
MCHGATSTMPNVTKVPQHHTGIDNKYCTMCHTASAATPSR